MTGRILSVGALTMDTIYSMACLPDGPGKFLPLSAIEIAEGMAASAACAVARLGGEASLWSAVGDDAVGARLVAAMRAEGVDCSVIQYVAGAPSPVAAVLVDPVGERMIIPFYAPALFASPRLPADIASGKFAALMADVRWPAAAVLALEAARAAGIPSVLDADVATAAVLGQLAPLASHVIASAPGAAVLCPGASPREAVPLLAERLAGEVAVTAGPEGVYWFDRERGEVRHVPAPVVTAIDTTAAGDIFHGAFALALVEGRGMVPALRFATAAAALKCMRPGGRQGAPGRTETDAFAASLDA